MYGLRRGAKIGVGGGSAKDLAATGVFAYTWNFLEPATIKQLAVKATTAMVSTGGIVVTFRRRPAYGSSAGQSVLGTVTVAKTSVVDLVYVNNITPVNIAAGDQIVADCTTAATTSGSGIAYLLADFSAEVSKSESAVVVVTA